MQGDKRLIDRCLRPKPPVQHQRVASMKLLSSLAALMRSKAVKVSYGIYLSLLALSCRPI